MVLKVLLYQYLKKWQLEVIKWKKNFTLLELATKKLMP